MNKHKHTQFSRRRFLQITGAGIGGVLGGALPTLSALAKPALQGRQGVIRVAWEPVKRLDPAFISNESEIAFVNAIYDYLIDLTTTDTIAPRLAESWTVSDDGRRYVFNLIERARFHDGAPVTPVDVIYTFKRLSSEATGSPRRSLYQNITSIEPDGDFSVAFNLAQPEPDFIYALADSSAAIVRAGAVDLDFNFNGSGPFKVDYYDPADRTTFLANEFYWQIDQPYLAGMAHIYMPANQMVGALGRNEVDVVLRMNASEYTTLANSPDFQMATFPTSGHDVLRIRADIEPGNNPKVRQALKIATDRAAIQREAQFGLGATGYDSPIGPYFTDYFSASTKLPLYEPYAARTLLAEAGYPNGLDFTLHVPNTGGRPAFAEAIKAQWLRADIRINIVLEDETTYYADNGWLEVPAGITGWGARPTPQQYLDAGLRSNGKWNETRWNDPALDALIDKAGRSLDRAERIAAYKAIQDRLAEDSPIIVPYFFPMLGAARRGFSFEGGFQPKPFPGRTDFRRVRLA
jgi:peptide/nickel transport system substrate-binding protein